MMLVLTKRTTGYLTLSRTILRQKVFKIPIILIHSSSDDDINPNIEEMVNHIRRFKTHIFILKHRVQFLRLDGRPTRNINLYKMDYDNTIDFF